jgi:hypothetical protein
MSDEARAMGGAFDFLREAVASLFTRRLLVPAILFALLLTISNIVILLDKPGPDAISFSFMIAALIRVIGLVAMTVGILRILNGSPRPAWRPDGAFWLYGLTLLATMVVAAIAGFAIAGRDNEIGGFLVGLAVTAVTAPLGPWFVAIAVERPLAWRPVPWLRRFSSWLPWLLLWNLLVVAPLGEIHGAIDRWLVAGAGDWFWPGALFDGPFSAAMATLGLALASVAYRRVARV